MLQELNLDLWQIAKHQQFSFIGWLFEWANLRLWKNLDTKERRMIFKPFMTNNHRVVNNYLAKKRALQQ